MSTPRVFEWMRQVHLPILGRQRSIRVCLPPDYDHSAHHYPVFYMQDGQNLFAQMPLAPATWKVDMALARLYKENKKLSCIIVAVDHGGMDRIREYAPYRRGRQGGEAAAYTDFLVNYLKPVTDQTFRTLTGPAHTAIIGSSLGGLLSLYAGLERPDVFGVVGTLSPSIWFNPGILKLAEERGGRLQKLYAIGSRTESIYMMPNLQKLYWAMHKGGLPDTRMHIAVRDRGRHHEGFWGREFKKMMPWLLKH